MKLLYITNGINGAGGLERVLAVKASCLAEYFNYEVTIENQSNDSVQLLSRYWNIFDSLNHISIVEGAGVVGQKPIIKPSETHAYKSHCLLTSTMGAMSGFYNMVNFTTTKAFKVQIPTFQLLASGALN